MQEYQTIKCDLKSYNVTCNPKCHIETSAESRWVEETCQPHWPILNDLHISFTVSNILHGLMIFITAVVFLAFMRIYYLLMVDAWQNSANPSYRSAQPSRRGSFYERQNSSRRRSNTSVASHHSTGSEHRFDPGRSGKRGSDTLAV